MEVYALNCSTVTLVKKFCLATLKSWPLHELMKNVLTGFDIKMWKILTFSSTAATLCAGKGHLQCDQFGGGSVIWTGISMEGCLPKPAWPKSSTTPLGHVRCVMCRLCCQVVLQTVQELSDALVVIWEEIPTHLLSSLFFTSDFWLYLNLVLCRLKNLFHLNMWQPFIPNTLPSP